MLLRGLKFFIQNVYIYETTAISVFKQWETWVIIHAFVPMIVRLFTKNWRDAWLICYVWETLEAIAGLVSENLPQTQFFGYLASWVGQELSADSLILDMVMGFVGIRFMEWILKSHELSKGELWKEASKKQRFIYFLYIVMFGLTALMTTVQFQVDTTRELYYYNFREMIENAFNVIPIGMYFWLPVQLLLLWLLKSQILKYTVYSSRVSKVFDDLTIYLYYHTAVTLPFIFPTFYTYWLSTPFLIILFIMRE